ncbi:metallophosphoesterase family protein [Phenylobacterium sp.]|uniref:metallophosphoesterase family protein n=1 Tax=Phenylobacterium sp. TaxID=1871053 RepID=UPI0035B4359B
MSSALFSKLFSGRKPALAAAPATAGRLVYAVGDVHGRYDLLEPLMRTIAEDALESAPQRQPMLVFLGDYVDRGPDSARVVDLVLDVEGSGAFEICALKGNHEEALLAFLNDPAFGEVWFDHGGAATLASYGVTPPAGRSDEAAWAAARDAFAERLPERHRRFYETLELMVTIGDYAFVHAGVRPGVPLERQVEKDLLWIRGDFLEARPTFDKVIVHGHTPTETPQVLPHRIGLDTGAYATGVLTAVRLDDQGQRVLQAAARRPGAPS